MSDVGATFQFSLHRLASPLTTSALLPMSLRSPMTFLRHVPMLFQNERLERYERIRRDAPSQHVALLGVLEDEHELVDAVDLVLDALDERPERVGDVVDERVGDPVGGDADVVLQLLDAPTDVLRVRRGPEVELACARI